MVTVFFVATGILYAFSCALFIALLVRGNDRVGKTATGFLAAAAVAHIGFLLADYVLADRVPFGDIRPTLSLMSLLVVLGYLVALSTHRAAVLGAFITPVTLLFFVLASLGRSVEPVPHEVRSVLLPLHIGANVLGIVTFTFAFAVAVAYVIQEHLLRKKRVGGLFKRLPALDVLDSLGLRLLTIGFPLLTVGIVTGGLWATRLDRGGSVISGAQGFALIAWVIFAAVLLLRVAAGWRGRRAAIGTLLGYACALVVVAGYLVRGGSA